MFDIRRLVDIVVAYTIAMLRCPSTVSPVTRFSGDGIRRRILPHDRTLCAITCTGEGRASAQTLANTGGEIRTRVEIDRHTLLSGVGEATDTSYAGEASRVGRE